MLKTGIIFQPWQKSISEIIKLQTQDWYFRHKTVLSFRRSMIFLLDTIKLQTKDWNTLLRTARPFRIYGKFTRGKFNYGWRSQSYKLARLKVWYRYMIYSKFKYLFKNFRFLTNNPFYVDGNFIKLSNSIYSFCYKFYGNFLTTYSKFSIISPESLSL